MHQSNGATGLSDSSACESAINAGNKVCYYPYNYYFQCGTTEVNSVWDGTYYLCSDTLTYNNKIEIIF